MPKPYYQPESGAVIYKMTPAEKEIYRMNKQLKVVSEERDQLKSQVEKLNSTVSDLSSKYDEILSLINNK